MCCLLNLYSLLWLVRTEYVEYTQREIAVRYYWLHSLSDSLTYSHSGLIYFAHYLRYSLFLGCAERGIVDSPLDTVSMEAVETGEYEVFSNEYSLVALPALTGGFESDASILRECQLLLNFV